MTERTVDGQHTLFVFLAPTRGSALRSVASVLHYCWAPRRYSRITPTRRANDTLDSLRPYSRATVEIPGDECRRGWSGPVFRRTLLGCCIHRCSSTPIVESSRQTRSSMLQLEVLIDPDTMAFCCKFLAGNAVKFLFECCV